jgi:hypothetical protein
MRGYDPSSTWQPLLGYHGQVGVWSKRLCDAFEQGLDLLGQEGLSLQQVRRREPKGQVECSRAGQRQKARRRE